MLTPGSSTNLNRVTFRGTAGVGDTISTVALLASCSTTEAPQSIECTLTSSVKTIQNNATYEIEYTEGLDCP
jgi:hypothetical protein